MEYILQIFDPSNSSYGLLTFAVAFAALLISVYTTYKQPSDPFLIERHHKLISPLFEILEPVLYNREKYSDALQNAIQLIRSEKQFLDGWLLDYLYRCSDEPSLKDFMSLCTYVDKLYDHSCRKLGLKPRSFTYRIQRKQYKNFIGLFKYTAIEFVGTVIQSIGKILLTSFLIASPLILVVCTIQGYISFPVIEIIICFFIIVMLLCLIKILMDLR